MSSKTPKAISKFYHFQFDKIGDTYRFLIADDPTWQSDNPLEVWDRFITAVDGYMRRRMQPSLIDSGRNPYTGHPLDKSSLLAPGKQAGFVLDITHPLIAAEYQKYKFDHGIPAAYPPTDEQRLEFEKLVIKKYKLTQFE